MASPTNATGASGTASAVGLAGLATTVAGTFLSAKGAKDTGQANAQMYNYQAGVARLNSTIDLQNADYARNQGEEQAVIEGRKGAQEGGQIRASEGASGLDVNTGSNADVQASQAKTTALDLTQIRANAAKTAYDYTAESTKDINQAGLYDMAATKSITAGNTNALASLVSGAGSVASKWLAGNTAGLWGGNSKSSGSPLPPPPADTNTSYGAVS